MVCSCKDQPRAVHRVCDRGPRFASNHCESIAQAQEVVVPLDLLIPNLSKNPVSSHMQYGRPTDRSKPRGCSILSGYDRDLFEQTRYRLRFVLGLGERLELTVFSEAFRSG